MKTESLLLAALLGIGMTAQATAQTPHHMAGMDHPAQPMTMAAKTGSATGVVKAIHADQGAVSIEHSPIAALGWPAMTMAFKVQDPKLLKGLMIGEKVRFEVKMSANHQAVITKIAAQ